MTPSNGPPRRWPRLHPDEAMRLRALVVFALALVALAAARRLTDEAAPEPLSRCERGAVLAGVEVRCAPAAGGPLGELASWWMGTPLDLNRASAEALQIVPGVGPRLAERIVADRERRGRFSRVEDVRRVRGVGAALTERIARVVEVR